MGGRTLEEREMPKFGEDAGKDSKKVERIREPISREAANDRETVDERIAEREQQGWSLVALEWQRPAGTTPRPSVLRRTEVPYGLQVARDFLHLEENPIEVEALVVMLDLLVEDRPLQEVAEELNRRGFHNRQGRSWTASQVFDLVPRLVEVGPDIFGTGDWAELRRLRKTKRPAAV